MYDWWAGKEGWLLYRAIAAAAHGHLYYPGSPLFFNLVSLTEDLPWPKKSQMTGRGIWTLNLADYKAMRQLLPMTLVCHPTCLGSMVSNPDRTSGPAPVQGEERREQGTDGLTEVMMHIEGVAFRSRRRRSS